MSSGGREFRCSYCGAPLDVTPDSVLVVCQYCGRPNLVVSGVDTGGISAVPTLNSDEIARRAVAAARRELKLKSATFGDPDLYYLPYYFASVEMAASYRARVRVTYSSGKTTVTRTVDVSGSLNYSATIPVLARRAVAGIATEKLAQHYLSTKPQTKPLDQIELGYRTSKAFLAAEFGRDRARGIAMRDAVDDLLARVDKDAGERALKALRLHSARTAVLDKTVDYQVGEFDLSPLTYLPAWLVPYTVDEAQYHMAFAGWDGELLAALEPITVSSRLRSIVGSVLASGVLAGIGGIALPQNPLVGAVFLFFGAGISAAIGKNVVASFKVKK
ncbi:MAG: hypothetical protein ACP5MH_09060 [Thermoproteus sp.]